MERKNTKKDAEHVIILLSLMIAGIFTWMLLGRAEATVLARAQEELAGEVLRFHILANSDKEEDQALKRALRGEVLEYLGRQLPENAGREQTKEWVRRHADELEALCRESVRSRGFDYPVSAAVTTSWFPETEYGEMIFPAGNYETLRIEIGAAKGHNWWCVLYPGICFADAVKVVVPQKGRQDPQESLTEEEYSQIGIKTTYKIKSYFLELFTK